MLSTSLNKLSLNSGYDIKSFLIISRVESHKLYRIYCKKPYSKSPILSSMVAKSIITSGSLALGSLS